MFAVGYILQEGKDSNSLEVRDDSPQRSIASMTGGALPYGECNSKVTLMFLQRRRDVLTTIDLSGGIRYMVVSLHTNRARQDHEVVELRALRVITEIKLASLLQQLDNCIVRQRKLVKGINWRCFIAKVPSIRLNNF